MKHSRRLVLYILFGSVCLVAATVLIVSLKLRGHAAMGLGGLLFTMALAFFLLAKITQVDIRLRALEESRRLKACRERARAHDAGEDEKGEDEGV
jgi:predicted membrane channel-forming protein YqfA (hemolysin III family)